MRGLGGQEQKFWYITCQICLMLSLYDIYYVVPTYMYLATIVSGLHVELPNSSLIVGTIMLKKPSKIALRDIHHRNPHLQPQ